MFKPSDSVMVRHPALHGRNVEVYAGHVVRADANKVQVQLGEGDVRSFPASQVAKASAVEINSFFNDHEEIVHQLKRR